MSRSLSFQNSTQLESGNHDAIAEGLTQIPQVPTEPDHQPGQQCTLLLNHTAITNTPITSANSCSGTRIPTATQPSVTNLAVATDITSAGFICRPLSASIAGHWQPREAGLQEEVERGWSSPDVEFS